MASRKSLFRRLSLSLGLLSTVIILVVSTLVFFFLSWRVGNQMQERAENTITFLAQALETPFWALDRESAAAVAEATSMDVNVGLLELRDSRGEEWFGYNTGNSLFIIREAEVSHDGQVIGFIRLGLEDSVRQKSLAGIGLAGGGIALLVIIAQYCLAKRLLRHYFQHPFAALDSLVGAYARGNYTQVDPGVYYTEFEPLVNAFLGMGQTIERQVSTLAESEEKYRVIFDNSPVGIFRSTLDGELLEGNVALGHMFGYSSREDFLASNGLRVEPVYADSSAREAYLRELLASPKALSREMKFVRKDGMYFEGVLTASIQQDADGRPVFLNGVVEDVSARKQAEERLRQSEEKFSRLFRLSPDVIVVMNMTEGRIVDVNEAFSRLTGFAYHEAVGKTAQELGLYTDPAMREFVRRRMQTTGQIDNVDFSLGCKDGRTISCVLSSQLLTVGDESCVMAVLRDVTEFKRMQELMIQSEKMISVGGIAAGVAHEINNPLGIIMVSSQNLVQRTRPDFPKNIEVAENIGLDMNLFDRYMQVRGLYDFVKNIQDAAVRAADIIRHMLDFSRRSESRRTTCDLRSVIKRATHLAGNDFDLKKSYDFKQIEIFWECDDNFPVVSCTETEIEQVFLNLFRNAAQAMASAQPQIVEPRIVVRMKAEADRVVLEVEDNGPGMPPEVQRRAFEPFFTTKPPGVGTGLGLSVSYFIITRSHDGQMRLESRPGQGTRFIIELPLSGPGPQKEDECIHDS
ncbi:PAS domain S-box protein [Desulfomicrobium sp. ZS1]|uniref:PAS domain-containing sensor histidine kinase n=1 Tax=Desulfomicrobium sp. ZS1 TaxID=2952228 RepID=UPI0020B21B0C|nr:PAS domain-containing sensor histidine kinase [Desulfomicrobium sp. ZS1]UTF51029.1 PAS domain S-box protein [Desulfomicrobium sp. ZS1]